MAKVKLADGSEVEMFSPDEVAAREAAAREAAKAELAPQLEELGKLKEKDINFTKLKEDTERTVAEANARVAELEGRVIGDKKAGLIKKLAGGDPERQAKIEAEWGKFQGEPKTESEIEERALNAFKLAVPEASPSSLDQAFAFAGARRVEGEKTGAAAIPDSTKEMGKALGLSEADYTKYGDKVATK